MKRIFTLTTMLLLVLGAANATVTAKWDFQHDYASNAFDMNGTTGAINSLTGPAIQLSVDASASGRFWARGTDALFNANTILRVPVASTKDVITVVSYPGYHYYTIGGVAAGNDTETYNVKASDVAQGYIEIVATNQSYLYSIQADLAYIPPVLVMAIWDFAGDCAGLYTNSTNSFNPIHSTNLNFNLTVEYNGQTIRGNGDSYQFGEGVVVKVPVISTDDKLTFVYHSETYGKFTYGSGNITSTGNDDTYSPTSEDVALGYVAITASTASYSYMKSITATYSSFTTATIGATEWATLSYTAPVDFTNVSAEALKAYIVTGRVGSTTTLATSPVTTTAAANTGLLLNADPGTYAIPLVEGKGNNPWNETGTDFSATNLLKPGTGDAVAKADGYTRYVLSADGSTAVFKKIVGTAATVPAGKAYLEFTGDVPAPELNLDFGGTTGVNEVRCKMADVRGDVYNLAGQRVANPTKGLYIVNGKKVVLK